NLSFEVLAGQQGCTEAQGTITTDGGQLSATGFQSAPGPVNFTLTLPEPGSFVSVDVECTDGCTVTQPVQFNVFVLNDYQVVLLQPASGVLQASPDDVVSLQVQLLINGAPANNGKDSVCWEIVGNPAGDAIFLNGDDLCGFTPAAGAKGTFVQGTLVRS